MKAENNKMSKEAFLRMMENLPFPKGGGLLQRLDDKDKELSEFYDLQSDLRRGFMLAEDIVKKWCEENYPLKKNKNIRP